MSLARFLLELRGRGAKSVETRTVCLSAFPVGGAIFMFHTPQNFSKPQPIFFYLAGRVRYIFLYIMQLLYIRIKATCKSTFVVWGFLFFQRVINNWNSLLKESGTTKCIFFQGGVTCAYCMLICDRSQTASQMTSLKISSSQWSRKM